MNLHVLELADKGAKEYGLAACKTENRAKKKNGLKLKRFTYYSFNYKRLCNFLSDISLVSPRGIRLGRGGTTYDGLYGDAPLERGIFFKLQVFKRVGKYVIWVCKRANRLILWLKKVEKTLNFCD